MIESVKIFGDFVKNMPLSFLITLMASHVTIIPITSIFAEAARHGFHRSSYF